jgi:hypothetical protein
MRTAAALILLLAVGTAPTSTSANEPEAEITWTTFRDGWADVRHGEFTVGDADCAYAAIADPLIMKRLFEHLTAIEMHVDQNTFQDVTFFEEFFIVGTTESRYHRTVDGVGRIEWKLISGRAGRHDGWWQVQPDGRVVFENLIQAKIRLQQPILRRVQITMMATIVDDIIEACR